jgi:hypothetical protein
VSPRLWSSTNVLSRAVFSDTFPVESTSCNQTLESVPAPNRSPVVTVAVNLGTPKIEPSISSALGELLRVRGVTGSEAGASLSWTEANRAYKVTSRLQKGGGRSAQAHAHVRMGDGMSGSRSKERSAFEGCIIIECCEFGALDLAVTTAV